MRGNRSLHALGLFSFLLLLAVTPVARGQSGRTVTIQLGPDVGQSVGVLSEPPLGWGRDASTAVLPFGNYVGPTSGRNIQTRTFLQFPLSTVPSGASVTQALLQLYVDDWPFDGSADLGVYCITSPWDEGISWATRPGASDTLRALTAVSSREGWVSWDVTSVVQEWQSGTANYGFMLGGAPTPEAVAGSGWAAAAVGRTAGNAARAPRLIVFYNLPSPTPPSGAGPAEIPEPGTALLLAGGLAVLAGYTRLRRR